jgi:hypothetical protein
MREAGTNRGGIGDVTTVETQRCNAAMQALPL